MAKAAKERTSLTVKVVAGLPAPTKGEAWHPDEKIAGLGVRVRANGSKAWVLRYSFQGVQRRHTIGDAEAVKLEVARIEAQRVLTEAAAGKDATEQARAVKAAETIGDLIEAYLAGAAQRLSPKYLHNLTYHLNVLAKDLHKLKSVERARVARLIDHVRRGDGTPRPVQAGALHSSLSAMFAWAIGAGRYGGDNPTNGVPRLKVAPRDRVLTREEIRAFWQATASGTDTHRVLRLLLLTGQREGEVGGMLWSEITETEAGAVWSMPRTRTKNKRAHTLPLMPLAWDHLPPRPEQIYDKNGLERPIFGRRKATDSEFERTDMRLRKDKTAGFAGWSRAKRTLDADMRAFLAAEFTKARGREPRPGEAKLEPWRLHDLRRTAATFMGEIGVEPHIVEAVLNHQSGTRAGVAGVYNHAKHNIAKANALRAYEAFISEITASEDADDSSSNVVTFGGR